MQRVSETEVTDFWVKVYNLRVANEVVLVLVRMGVSKVICNFVRFDVSGSFIGSSTAKNSSISSINVPSNLQQPGTFPTHVCFTKYLLVLLS